ncbi:hypothetical protein Btru_062821 [Bulinus truncatus]|nr:hypothetical protein Btru_062821 [Bulinus truncatus]
MFDEFMTHDLLKCLIDAEIDVLAEDSQGRTALIRLLLGGKFKFEDLYRNIDIRLVRKFRRFHFENVKLLIDMGVDRKQIFRALLNADADILKTDDQGNDALHYAAMCENKQFLCYIINKYWTSEHTESDEPGPSKPKRMKLNLDINRTNKNQETALFKAAAFGRTNNVKILIKYGCDVNISTLDEQTALLIAVSKADANIHLENSIEKRFGGNLLHYVPDMTIAQYLVENKIDINQRDQLGRSPLYMAIKRRKTDLVHFLLNKGANVNAVTSTSNTALMLATKLQNLELVTTLLAVGADINIQNRLGWTALFIAAMEMSLCNVNDISLEVFENYFSRNPIWIYKTILDERY